MHICLSMVNGYIPMEDHWKYEAFAILLYMAAHKRTKNIFREQILEIL